MFAYTLSADVENLTLTGTSGLTATGNSLDNIPTGNSGANSLVGNEGNNQLNGGADNYTYIFGRSYATDTVLEATASAHDVVQFGSDISTDQLRFRHVGNNLEATIVGTTDKLVIRDWYLGDAYRVEEFKTADGQVLLDSQVEALVSAMASFVPPVGVGAVIPQDVYNQLQPVISGQLELVNKATYTKANYFGVRRIPHNYMK